MNKGDIERYLQLLGQELQTRNTTGTILLLGGAVMLLEVGNRATTQDIDASFEGNNAPLIRQAVVMIAQREGLVRDWLNDAAKGFLYSHPPTILWRQYPGLNVYIPSLDYILAMKIVAGRPRDIEDPEHLFKNSRFPMSTSCSQLLQNTFRKGALMFAFNISSQISSSPKEVGKEHGNDNNGSFSLLVASVYQHRELSTHS